MPQENIDIREPLSPKLMRERMRLMILCRTEGWNDADVARIFRLTPGYISSIDLDDEIKK